LLDENLNGLDEYINVLQAMQLPFALFPLLHFAASHYIMGDFASSVTLKSISWSVALMVVAVNVYLTFDGVLTSLPNLWYIWGFATFGMVVYAGFGIYLAVGPFLRTGSMKHIYRPEAKYGYLATKADLTGILLNRNATVDSSAPDLDSDDEPLLGY
jgi:natural resistance-associated macrophage protein